MSENDPRNKPKSKTNTFFRFCIFVFFFFFIFFTSNLIFKLRFDFSIKKKTPKPEKKWEKLGKILKKHGKPWTSLGTLTRLELERTETEANRSVAILLICFGPDPSKLRLTQPEFDQDSGWVEVVKGWNVFFLRFFPRNSPLLRSNLLLFPGICLKSF